LSPYTVLHTEWSQSWGGQEIRILTECRELMAEGHRALLAGRPGAPILARAGELGVQTAEIPLRGPWDLDSAWRLARLARREGVDVLHTHASVDSWVGVWADLLCPATLVRTRHCGEVRVHPANLVYRRPAAFITVGEDIRRALLRGYGLAPERVVSIPTGIDTRRFRPGEPEPELYDELGIPRGAPVVAIVAVLRSWKRHDLFCRMAAALRRRMPEARFLIVGDGPRREKVAGYLDRWDLRGCTVMTGHREDVDRLMRLSQVVVLTSEGEEATCQALAQALACHRGVVSFDRGGVGELVLPEKTGLLVPFGDVEGMAAAVERLLRDDDLRLGLARAGRRKVEAEFSAPVMHRRIMEVYHRVAPLAG
jgi:glycosyltransferase involved in cell wall biosynthesis